MKASLVLDKNSLSYWLRQIRKESNLIAPMRSVNGDIVFESVDQIHEVVLDYPLPPPPVKEFISPQMEGMFEYKRDNISDLRDRQKRVVFGARSCDISAMNITDKFFGGETEPSYDKRHPNKKFKDSYYFSRRQNIVFISLGCNNPAPTCFCQSLGTGPFLDKGFDIQLVDLADRYFVETGSNEGEKLINKHRHLFTEAQKQDYDDRYEAFLSSVSKFEKRVNLEEIRQMIIDGKVPEALWEWVAERCFECGGCVYECPVCTCFNIVDCPHSKDTGKRFKIWDTCFFKGFTQTAGGNIPAEKKVLRTKRWWFHKVLYDLEQFTSFGCVGCGRCTITCPGRIDIATVSEKIKRWR
ncbi:MAG: 4Fe-4S dicluster domain-containing protein [Nitrospirae bacterium]|nr:4Fe-4S dicluster domain-containing protein [Nitrospirota bacterium]